MNDPIIYLASRSPRREKLLKMIYPDIRTFSVETPEEFFPDESPIETVKRIALEKMAAAIPLVESGIIITADTIVVLDDRILGKPVDENDAQAMLRFLSNNTHSVYTGFCVYNKHDRRQILDYEHTRVTFHPLSDAEIDKYVSSGSPLDKAGAYGIQEDFGAVFIKGIEGCYYNVVGLPLSKVYHSINELRNYDSKA
jgi:septum formation protein